ncbi:RidA family protein [Dactylosporangium sp. NBC_01737]|uniref:RidA family protein n=1 Tax=Dactylosporangium sp. NBC_01737 TaxID=2975959 RepID=UPI002E15725F|nr:RidA family protein [Dactylosporangium sp. NBC_01737]
MTTYLPGIAGTDAAAVYAEALRRLADAGLGPGDVVHVTEYGTEYGTGAVAARDRLLDGHRAPVSVVPVAGFPDPADTFAVELAVFPGGGDLIDAGDGGVLRVAGDLVHLPGVHTTTGEFRDQYRWCLTRLGSLLRAAGLGLDALVRTTDFTATATRAEYPRCGRPRRELLGPVFPSAAGILVDTPVEPGAAVSLDALAARGPLRAVNPGWARYDTLTYQPGIVAGNTLVMSGFGALDPSSQLAVHDGDLLAQAAFIYDNVDLVAGGATVTRLLEYVTPAGVADHGRLAAMRAERYPGAAVTSVVCSALLRPEFLLEVVPTAVLP